MSGERRSRPCLSQTRLEPVSDVVRADLPVINLAMLSATVTRREDFERFVFGTDRIVELVRHCARRQLIFLAPTDEHRTRDEVGDTLERECLELLHGGIHVGHTKHPRELKVRSGVAL